jgi:hypothetical protein
MTQAKNFQDILAMYRKHGWRPARLLARAETLAELRGAGLGFEESAATGDERAVTAGKSAAARDESSDAAGSESSHATVGGTRPAGTASGFKGAVGSFEGAAVIESDVDAVWFTRASQAGREAWELRLLGEPPYALFELFEPDEAEDEREDVRREMEARLREYVAPSGETRE